MGGSLYVAIASAAIFALLLHSVEVAADLFSVTLLQLGVAADPLSD